MTLSTRDGQPPGADGVVAGCPTGQTGADRLHRRGAAGWEDQQMAQGARLGSVVMFVHDLDRSVEFYAEVLALEVTDRSPTAALLTSLRPRA